MKSNIFVPLVLAAFAMPAMAIADIVVNEILYDPRGADNSSTPEFFEFYNTSTNPVDISGYKVSAGSFVQYTFPPDTTIAGNGYIVMAGGQRVGQFLQTYDNGVDPAIVHKMDLGATVGSKLANPANTTSNNSITLFDTSTAVVATVTYSRYSPWPDDADNTGANSTGYSLEKVDPAIDPSDGSNWKVSLSKIGTPGKANSVSGKTFLTGGERDIQYPRSSDTVTINVSVASTATSSVVELHTAIGTGNQTYTTTTMTHGTGDAYSATIPSQNDDTLVKYYVRVLDSDGYETTYPPLAPRAPAFYFVDDNPATNADLIINEIKYNAQGNDDNVTDSEFVEVHNRSNRDIDISFFMMGRTPDDYYRRLVPEGTVIPAGGFYVLAARIDLFENRFGTGLPAFGGEWPTGVSVLGNGGTDTHIAHANAFEWNGLLTQPIDLVTYAAAAPWPTSKDAVSIELVDPSATNRLDGSNWKWSTATLKSTPGAANSVAAVQDWTLY